VRGIALQQPCGTYTRRVHGMFGFAGHDLAWSLRDFVDDGLPHDPDANVIFKLRCCTNRVKNMKRKEPLLRPYEHSEYQGSHEPHDHAQPRQCDLALAIRWAQRDNINRPGTALSSSQRYAG